MATLLRSMRSTTEDDRIRSDVRRQITWQSDIQSQDIGIQVKDGMVVLDGVVETRLEKLEAEKAAKAVDGVFSVANQIQVFAKRERPDAEIEENVNAGLRAVLCVLEKLPVVSVRSGVVVLEGNVRWDFQKTSAERAADAVIGVRSVRNRISVGQLVPVLAPTERAEIGHSVNSTPLGRGGVLPLVGERPVLAVAS